MPFERLVEQVRLGGRSVASAIVKSVRTGKEIDAPQSVKEEIDFVRSLGKDAPERRAFRRAMIDAVREPRSLFGD